jgi:acetoin utilization protein AcuC
MLLKDRQLAFVYPPGIERLHYPPDCPFKMERAGLTRRRLASFGLLGGPGRTEHGGRAASLEELGRFHSPRYLEELQRASEGDLSVAGFHMGLGGPDTPIFPDMFACGAGAAGAALTAADLLIDGRADIAFHLCGGFHHAMPEKAAGFCYVNDMVLACMRLAEAGRRVVYLDVDAHHGDGVQAAFYRRSDVFTISLHESGKTLFPWGGFESECGEGPGLGFNANVSLPAATYDGAFLAALDRVALPLMRSYDPDVIVVELGLDALAGDPLTHLRLTNQVVPELAERLLALNRPLLIAGGGGYHVENTVRGWALAWQAFAGEADDHDFSAGMGGVMLANADWAGGLRDLSLPVSAEQRRLVDPALEASVQAAIQHVFHHHGLPGLTRVGPTPVNGRPDGESPDEAFQTRNPNPTPERQHHD